MFAAVFHADWSRSARKRWAAFAIRKRHGWEVSGPIQVPSPDQLLQTLFGAAEKGPVLAGFDFPIGVPEAYGSKTGELDFPSALRQFGSGRWARFYDVVEAGSDIAIERPFYPRRSSSEAKQIHLIRALGVTTIDDLRRRCERATQDRRAACSLFWTLGGNQVGKAAVAGWREIVAPARCRGAKLWPFEGCLAELAREGGLVLAETYPAEAYAHAGVRFRPGESKTRQADRRGKSGALSVWAVHAGVRFDDDMLTAVQGGFGEDPAGEDRFDAALGLFGMIEVVSGRRSEGATDGNLRVWEGWILGQAAP